MSDAVQQIKDRLSIVDVVGSYVELHKAGKHYKGRSPFTNEKTPSFFVSPDRGVFYCFSSQKGGDMFTFIEVMEGVDFKGALKILAERAGVELVPENPEKRNERETQYALIEEAARFFTTLREENPYIGEYLESRGVKPETILKWRIGYAPDAWRALRSHLREKQFSDGDMLRAGLIKHAEGGKEPYDVFRDRIMFPLFDASGRVVGFSGRTLKQESGIPKYVNSPETELYKKSELLFGYDKARQGIRQYDFSLIVEGQFDVVLSHQAGYTNTVAVSGTALTPYHISLIERLSSRVVLALDADRAGVSAVKRVAGLMLGRGMDVKVATMEGGKDPADMVKTDPRAFKRVIGEAVHVVDFLLRVLKEDGKDDRTYKLRVREELLPIIAQMPNHIDRDHFEGVIAVATGTTKDAIHYEVSRIETTTSHEAPKTTASPTVSTRSQPGVRKDELVRYLRALRGVLTQEHAALAVLLQESIQSFLTPSELAQFESMEEGSIADLTFSIERDIEGVKEVQLRSDLAHSLTEFSHLLARERLNSVRARLREAESKGDEEEVMRCLSETKAAEALLQKEIMFPDTTKKQG